MIFFFVFGISVVDMEDKNIKVLYRKYINLDIDLFYKKIYEKIVFIKVLVLKYRKWILDS